MVHFVRPSLPKITQIAGVRRLRSHAHRYAISRLAKEDQPHPTPLTLLAPVHPKDATRLAASIAALRARLAHPIERIVLVSPPDDDLRRLAAHLGAEIVDESSVLPEAVLLYKIFDPGGRSRNGWIRQQFIKLGWPDWLEAERVLTMDADTKPAHRLRFINDKNQAILYTADEYSSDYFAMVQRAFGPIERAPWSFVAHTMLFERAPLARMQELISRRAGGPWVTSLLDRIEAPVSQCFSEFELYGNYMYAFERSHVQLRYFLNRKVSENDFLQHAIAPRLKRFHTVSSHSKSG